MSGAMPGSCRARVDEVLIDTELENGAPDYTLAAEAAYDWFTANGAQFFHTLQGRAVHVFRQRHLLDGFTRTGAQAPLRGHALQAHGHGADLQRRTDIFRGAAQPGHDPWPGARPFSWLHTDVASHRLFQPEQSGARDRQDHPGRDSRS